MRLYFAARFSRRDEMREYRKVLEDLGHEVTSRWINEDERQDLKNKSRQEVSEIVAVEDLEDLAKSDVVLNFTGNGKSTKTKAPKGGRHWEGGVGFALNKPSIVIGEPEHAFHWLPNVDRYASFEEYLDSLEVE
jgi:nucleoside 2-deoxyribosyltransferase